LAVDGTVRQDSRTAEMIWTVPEVIAIASQAVTLAPGDLIYTGTPAGVGKIAPGQVVTGGIEGLGDIWVKVG